MNDLLEQQLAARSPQDYADFLLPHLSRHTHLLDVGCGNGALSLGLASTCGQVTALDLDPDKYADAQAYVESRGLGNLVFVEGDATALPYPQGTFDAVLAHSVLEAGPDPAKVLSEAARVLKPGGWVGVASVEYGGLVLAGLDAELLRRSNAVREGIWQRVGSDPFLGRELRRLLGEAGFVDVDASTKAFSYGTPDLVLAFGRGRGAECADEEYVDEVVAAGLATADDLAAMAAAWEKWSLSPASYAAFTWCRAIGRTPDQEDLA